MIMKTNNFGFNENDLIHCQTEEEAIKVLKIAHDKGLEWRSGDSYLKYTKWDYNMEDTLYSFYTGGYKNYRRLLCRDENQVKIISAKEFLIQHNKNINNHKPYLVW